MVYMAESAIGSQSSQKGSCADRRLNADRKRPYPCVRCPSRFGSRMELEEHQNSHTGEKPFECDICKARFNRRSTLWNHKRIHSDKMPFVCPICSTPFKWKNALKYHKERVHLRRTVLLNHTTRSLYRIPLPSTSISQPHRRPDLSTSEISSKREMVLANMRKQTTQQSSDSSIDSVNQTPAPVAKLSRSSDNYFGKWLSKAKTASEKGDGGLFDVTCGRKHHAVLHGARFGSGKLGKSIEYPPDSGNFMTPSEFEFLAGLKNARKYTRSIKFECKPIKELLKANFITAHSINCKCSVCSNGKMIEKIKYHRNVENPAQAKRCTSPYTLSSQCQNDAPLIRSQGQDPPPDDPISNNDPMLGRQDRSILLNSPPVCSKTILPNCDNQTNEQSSSRFSTNEQPGDSTPMDTSGVMVQIGNDYNAKKCLRVVEDKPPEGTCTTVVSELMSNMSTMESKTGDLKSSYEQLKTKYDSSEEKRVEREACKQRADDLPANHEQCQAKQRALQEERDQLNKDNRDLKERLEQQSQMIAGLQHQSCASEQLKVTVSEMQSSVLRATEQLAHFQQRNAMMVTEIDLLCQQLRDKDALLDEYRSIDVKVCESQGIC